MLMARLGNSFVDIPSLSVNSSRIPLLTEMVSVDSLVGFSFFVVGVSVFNVVCINTTLKIVCLCGFKYKVTFDNKIEP